MIIGGDMLCGGTIASLLIFPAGKTDEPLLELTFTAVAAYGSFLLAEHYHLSGVLASLTGGLIFGDHQREKGEDASRGHGIRAGVTPRGTHLE